MKYTYSSDHRHEKHIQNFCGETPEKSANSNKITEEGNATNYSSFCLSVLPSHNTSDKEYTQ
jgi:hypothetical protein